ncbi:unnamed protein product [Effrenium voratum]|nr:unnamed protein product [Effrenium voratum]
MQRLGLVLALTWAQARRKAAKPSRAWRGPEIECAAARTCSCDCCEAAPRSPCAAAARCESLCAKSAEDQVLEALQSLLDTERFCYAECVPTTEEAESASACRRLTPAERERGLPKPPAPKFLARRSELPALAREQTEKAPEPALQKLVDEAAAAAAKAKAEAEAVQQVSYGGVAMMAQAASAEEDARRAAGFAMSVEGQVQTILDQARRDAHAEAFGVLQEVLPVVQQRARAAAKAEATRGPFSKAEKAQKAQVEALAAAGSAGEDWTEAMHQAVKVRDAYSSRSKELAQAAFTAEQGAQQLEQEAQQWQQLKSSGLSKAKALHLRAQEFMAAASENDQKANKYLGIAKSIDDSLPAYSRQAAQGAYHAMSMVADVPPPLPPLAFAQK